jgi:flavin reductase (DIM6/NTAB) family NADH-FMN oxidoreductase RutF
MKQEFFTQPPTFKEEWPGELTSFSWEDFLTAIPSPIFLVTTYKDNGKPNACLQSWSTFAGDAGKFICILGSVSKGGHLYQSLLHTKECVLNFPSSDIYDKCSATIRNNGYEDDEITQSGLTIEPAQTVNAPRVAECFLNLECELLWEKEHFAGSRDVTICLQVKHTAMDSAYYDEDQKGRYGKTGYIYNIHSPRNPDTGQVYETSLGALEKCSQYFTDRFPIG